MHKTTELLLRLGVAFAFLYPPVAAYFDPFAWIGFFPDFIRDAFGNDDLLLNLFGALEVVVGAWILSGYRIFLPSLAATFMLAGIVVFNWGAIDIVFRDVSIALMSGALAIYSRMRE